MRTLILVDLQNDFGPEGALPVPGGDLVVAVANRLQPYFDWIIASQDWHPPNHSSFAVNHPGHKPGEVIEWAGMPQVLWPSHCVQGTQGASFFHSLDQTRIHSIVHKGINPDVDSYSAFYDNARRQATGLEELLFERGVRHFYLMGLATDYCVKFTALDAISLGFQVSLIEDGCRGVELNPGDISRAMEEMTQAGVQIIVSQQIPELFKSV
jgi:nicotinamidase/pyrazinamidase